jgi:hypothetical protein
VAHQGSPEKFSGSAIEELNRAWGLVDRQAAVLMDAREFIREVLPLLNDTIRKFQSLAARINDLGKV